MRLGEEMNLESPGYAFFLFVSFRTNLTAPSYSNREKVGRMVVLHL